MLKFCCKLIVLSSLFGSPWLYAQTEANEQDEYNQCVDQTIKEMQLESINNMVVHSCSEQAKKTYEEKIVALIDQIRTQSEEYKQPERYQPCTRAIVGCLTVESASNLCASFNASASFSAEDA